jgi:TM2 domain-containing membrane protein YozV
MSDYQLQLLRSLTPDQRLAFQSEFDGRRKDATVAILLAVFLGGFGAHHFYLGRTGLGVLYLLFFWSVIPSLVALIECFFLSQRVRDYNDRLAAEITNRVPMMYPNPPPRPPAPVAAGRFCTKCGKAMTADSRFCDSCGTAAGPQLSA